MKKISSLIVVLAMSVCMIAGCGEEEETSTQIANPIEEVSEEEMVEKTGIDLQAPEGSENVSYSIINGDPVIAQMDYTIDGYELTERACMTSLLSIYDELGDPAYDDINISGMYYDFTSGIVASVSYCDAVTRKYEEGPCFIAWVDVVPGILYNLSSANALTDDDLIEFANDVFLPMQGEADGE